MVQKMAKINTEHHRYLVSLTFKKDDSDHREIIKVEKTDDDELCLTVKGQVYYISLAQLLICLKLETTEGEIVE